MTRMMYRPSPNGRHYGVSHPETSDCAVMGCKPVDAAFELARTVPEFEIEIRYVTDDVETGWKYALRWESSAAASGYEHSYGYATEALAEQAAKERANKIALTQLPPKRFKYTPEI